jgi:hypothetical protein
MAKSPAPAPPRQPHPTIPGAVAKAPPKPTSWATAIYPNLPSMFDPPPPTPTPTKEPRP